MESNRKLSRMTASQVMSPPKTTRPFLRGSTSGSLNLTARTGFSVPQRIPSQEDIERWQTTFLNGKNCSSEFIPESTAVPQSEQRTYRLPKIALHRVKSGENLGPRWFEEEIKEEPEPVRILTRKQKKPREDTYRSLFPSSSVDFFKLPPTTSEPWTNIDLKKDVELANFGVNSSNAFKSYWQKHHSLHYRKFFNNEHPEFCPNPLSHHRKKDHMVNYREAMLSVKYMMQAAWGTKK